MMDHLKAAEEHLAERYLLREMSAADAEEFEQHFFECTECASAVEEGDMFVANTRVVFAESGAGNRPEPARRLLASDQPETFWAALTAWWRTPWFLVPAGAAVLLGALALYQSTVVIPGQRQAANAARILPAFQLIGASRGDTAQITLAPGTPSFAVSLDIPPDVHFPQYLCEFSSASHTLFRLNSPAPVEGQPITILVPAKELHGGQYEIVIFGADANGQQGDKISTFAFGLHLAGSKLEQSR